LELHPVVGISPLYGTVHDLLDLVHNVILIECIFGSGKPRGVGILGKGEYMGYWENKGGQFTSKREQRWTDPDTARRVPSK
jgi:hypothetical protein